MSSKKNYLFSVTETELEILLTALDDSAYWRSDPNYRNDGYAIEPYCSNPEGAAVVAQIEKLNDELKQRTSTDDHLGGTYRGAQIANSLASHVGYIEGVASMLVSRSSIGALPTRHQLRDTGLRLQERAKAISDYMKQVWPMLQEENKDGPE